MNVTVVDHLFVLLLAVPLPMLGVWQFRRLEERLARGEEDARLRQYRRVILGEIALVAAVVAIWAGHGRAWSLLTPEGPGGAGWRWVGWAATLLAAGFLVVQAVMVVRSDENLAAVREQFETLTAFLPHDARELRSFYALSLTAGIGEEILFRGFVFAWLTAVATTGLGAGSGAALALAVVGSSAVFAVAHAYQGLSGIARAGAVGLVLALLAVSTGGLLAPIVVHVVLDVTSGFLAYRSLHAGAEGAGESVPDSIRS